MCVMILRIAWTISIIQFHALSLFIESLVEKEKLFCFRQKILIFISITFFTVLFSLSLISYKIPFNLKNNIEIQLISSILQYCTFPLLFLSIILTVRKIRSRQLPSLLKKQITMFLQSAMIPFLTLEMIHVYPLSLIKQYIGNSNAFAGLSTIILLYAIFYCSKKIIGLRFLNIKSHVICDEKFGFLTEFRTVLDRFGHVTNIRELNHITAQFFKQTFNIPTTKTTLYIRKKTDAIDEQISSREQIMEIFVSKELSTSFFKTGSIFFSDELSFNQFYNNVNLPQLVCLLDKLDSDILIPIIDQNRFIAYIIVDRFARSAEKTPNHEFYTETERDSMLVFTEYLKNIIQLLHNKHFDSLLHREKTLQEQVFFKHQEINQYKESIKSFLHSSSEKEIGIVMHKHNRFTLVNKSAHILIRIDLNKHTGHPITKALKKIAQQVSMYKSPQVNLIEIDDGKKLVASGLPSSKSNDTIIIIHKPEISDVLKEKMRLLHDPQHWNLLLCLETTKNGNLINQWIPGNSETILNFKIRLLELSMKKEALLINIHDDDTLSIVELIHTATLREVLHVLQLEDPVDNTDVAIQLFGINPRLCFGEHKKPLLEKLSINGTLFIKNIEILPLETQKHLALFLKSGVYRNVKSDQTHQSNARIICSTSKSLYRSVQAGSFSKLLFNELNKNQLIMPQLTTIPQDELKELITAIAKQTLKKDTFNTLLELSDRETEKIIVTHPESLHEIKNKIKQLLVEKTKRNALDTEKNLFNPVYSTSDHDLVEASHLGKHALKDPHIMQLLWTKFKSQHKIALFLGVNRSSVSRRCKKYGLK